MRVKKHLHLCIYDSNLLNGRHGPDQNLQFLQCGFLTPKHFEQQYLCGYTIKKEQ